MKLPMKVAGLCWSLTFLVTAIPGFYQQTRPTNFASIATDSYSGMAIIETLSLSLVGAVAAGMFGYMIGDILSRPQGHPKDQHKQVMSRPSLSPPSDHAGKVDSEPEAAAELPAQAEVGEPVPDKPPELDVAGDNQEAEA